MCMDMPIYAACVYALSVQMRVDEPTTFCENEPICIIMFLTLVYFQKCFYKCSPSPFFSLMQIFFTHKISRHFQLLYFLQVIMEKFTFFVFLLFLHLCDRNSSAGLEYLSNLLILFFKLLFFIFLLLLQCLGEIH